jgi:hypothetical protein
MVFLHDKAWPHAGRARAQLVDRFRWNYFAHSPYISHLALSDFKVLDSAKQQFERKHFWRDADVRNTKRKLGKQCVARTTVSVALAIMWSNWGLSVNKCSDEHLCRSYKSEWNTP